MKCTVEIFFDGCWRKAGFFEPDENQLDLGVSGSGRFDYDIDYAVQYIAQSYCQVGVRYPVNFELYRETSWPMFLLDLLPSGAGRRVWIKRLGLVDNEGADWHLLLNGAGNPPGNLRIQEASRRLLVDHPGFTKGDVVDRYEDFIEYAETNGALVAGATDVQGEAPKFLMNRDRRGRWHADGALPDSEIEKFWLIKFPRGSTEQDRLILKNEAPYYEVARCFGLRVGEPLDYVDNSLFISRFDRSVKMKGRVERYGLETLASSTALSSFGSYGSHLSFCQAIAKYSSFPDQEILEYLMRDILNVALRNTDNHGRNTALIKYPSGKVELSPLYDFAPMFLDHEGIARASRWDGELETEIGRPVWGRVAEALSVYVTKPEKIKIVLKRCALLVEKLPETMQQCGVDEFLIERLAGRIQVVSEDLLDVGR